MKTKSIYLLLIGITMLGFGLLSLSRILESDKVVENKMVEVELLDIVECSPEVYVDIRDLSSGIIYKNVYVSYYVDNMDQLPYNKPFLVTRLKRLDEKSGKIRVEWKDLDSGLEWSKRLKEDIKN